MLSYREGNVMQEPNFANPVNMVGVMGAGMALQVARKWPASVEPYRAACRSRTLAQGHVFAWNHGQGWIFHTPTKRHWREKSTYELVESSLQALVERAEALRVDVVGVPMLGCGLGGLGATQVIQLMQKHCQQSRVEFRLYRADRPAPKDRKTLAPKPAPLHRNSPGVPEQTAAESLIRPRAKRHERPEAGGRYNTGNDHQSAR